MWWRQCRGNALDPLARSNTDLAQINEVHLEIDIDDLACARVTLAMT
jgi:hypothetical protein